MVCIFSMFNMQAMGMGQDFSSADGTDTDVDERNYTNIDMFVKWRDVYRGESNYWVDSEEDLKSGKASLSRIFLHHKSIPLKSRSRSRVISAE